MFDAVFCTKVGNTDVPFVITFITKPKDELILAVCVFVPTFELNHCGVDVTLILAEVFGTNKLDVCDNPPLTILTTYANDDEMLDVKLDDTAAPNICSIFVIFLSPLIDDVNTGSAPIPLSIIFETMLKFLSIVLISAGVTYDDVI